MQKLLRHFKAGFFEALAHPNGIAIVEQLRDGFEATSLRAITTEAQVNLAAVNDHFQSKEALVQAVIGRRMVR